MLGTTRRTLVAVAAGAGVLLPSAAHAVPPPANLALNPSFEAGIGNWSCEDHTVSWPARTGNFALHGVTSNNSTGRCSQTVAVQPRTTYTLSAWVRGNQVRLGVTGHGSAASVPAASPWTWTRLETRFTTDPSARTVEIYFSGWYAMGRFTVDDVSLLGAPVPAPGAPGGFTATPRSNRAVVVSWRPVEGAAGYRIKAGNLLWHDTFRPVTTAEVLVGVASTTELHVVAYNSAGESLPSETVTVRTPADTESAPLPTRVVVASPGPSTASVASLWLAWEAVESATEGYAVYVDGVLVSRVPGPAYHLQNLAPSRTYRIEVTSFNRLAESPRSWPRYATTPPAGAIPPPAPQP